MSKPASGSKSLRWRNPRKSPTQSSSCPNQNDNAVTAPELYSIAVIVRADLAVGFTSKPRSHNPQANPSVTTTLSNGLSVTASPDQLESVCCRLLFKQI